MTGRRGIALLAGGLGAVALGGLPGIAAGQSERAPATAPAAATATGPAPAKLNDPAPARLSVRVAGLHHGKVRVGKRVRAVGHIRPFVAGQHVRVKLLRNGHVVKKLNPAVKRTRHKNVGRFGLRSGRLIKPGHYRMAATHEWNPQQEAATDRSRGFRIDYPDLDPGDRSTTVRTFNRLLDHEGYLTEHGKHYGARTGFAVMAFRKVNKMARTSNASPSIFKRLAAGKGGFHLKYPGAGRHVEVDISRQAMTLASHGKPKYTVPVSTGAPATPTIRGHYQFYSRQPGYNSHGMYYSVYWHGGYAIHGYDPAPPYPASHGCIREPIPLAHFIYNWVELGMSIYVYG